MIDRRDGVAAVLQFGVLSTLHPDEADPAKRS